ncbi:MAG: F0F1 ATP synthase subunit epsilon [Acidobacteriota bacterium]|jgi:F-type H+-transporting ATPase subunit epsilon
MAEAAHGGGIASDFLLEIVTPERQLVAERVDSLRAPGVDGEFGVLPSHVRMIAGVGTGLLRYRTAATKQWAELAVSNGLVEVLPDRVIVLAQTAEASHEIDVRRAEAALARARKKLEHPEDDIDIEATLDALRRATVRLQAAKGEAVES